MVLTDSGKATSGILDVCVGSNAGHDSHDPCSLCSYLSSC